MATEQMGHSRYVVFGIVDGKNMERQTGLLALCQ